MDCLAGGVWRDAEDGVVVSLGAWECIKVIAVVITITLAAIVAGSLCLRHGLSSACLSRGGRSPQIRLTTAAGLPTMPSSPSHVLAATGIIYAMRRHKWTTKKTGRSGLHQIRASRAISRSRRFSD
jgi:hypothetical protein